MPLARCVKLQAPLGVRYGPEDKSAILKNIYISSFPENIWFLYCPPGVHCLIQAVNINNNIMAELTWGCSIYDPIHTF